jgi:hypothetical protein
MGANATLQERAVAVDPGSEATASLRVRNTGQVVDQFTFQVLGDAAGWTVVEPATLSLFPGAEEVTSVRFQPPRSSSVPAGSVPFGIRVSSHEDPQASVVEEGSLSVGGFQQTAAELAPVNSRGSRSGNHELAIDNHGNVPIEVFVRGSDPSNAMSVRARPADLVIHAGNAGFARVRVTARRLFLTGVPRSLPFQLLITPSGGESPIPLSGSLTQGPLISRLTRNIALGALAALVAAALLWFLALKPAIQSTARDAVAAPLAQQSAAIKALQSPPGGSGSQGANPSPGPSGSGGSPGGGSAGAGQSFARRLDAGSSRYTVPAGATLSITDIVFQNPNGEHGTVSLQRQGTTLLSENLDNFRDLDYHFVTPITVGGNQTVQMAVSCPNPGCPNAAIYLNGSEKPGS